MSPQSSAEPDGLTEAERRVQELIAGSGVLARTGVLNTLNASFGRVDCAHEDLIRQVAADPELVAKLLVVANSAWFGSRVRVTKVEEVFSRLGIGEFYNAVVISALRLGLKEAGPVCGAFWAHVELIGRTNQLVAQHLAPDLTETAMLVGLLHDCAVPLMAAHLADYSYLATEALGFDPNSADTELQCYGLHHAQVSSALGRTWGFPPAITVPISYHHQITLTNAPQEHRRLLAMLMLTERITAFCEGQCDLLFCSQTEMLLLGELASALDVTETRIKAVVTEFQEFFHLRKKSA